VKPVVASRSPRRSAAWSSRSTTRFDTERQRVVFALTAKYPRVCVAAPRELERAIARVFGTMS